MKNETTMSNQLPSVPAGFTADTWPLMIVNGLKVRLELDMGDCQDELAATCSRALDSVVGAGTLVWCAMLPDGTKFVGSVVDSDGDERPFVMADIGGMWNIDVTVAEFKLPRGFKTALKAVTGQPHLSAACANPAYIPAAMTHYGIAA